MERFRWRRGGLLALLIAAVAPVTACGGPAGQAPSSPAGAPSASPSGVLTGPAAFGDWRADAPGVKRLLKPKDLPAPNATPSASNVPSIVKMPSGATLKVPPGFRAERFASGLSNPRLTRVAPNGDVFVAETGAGRIRVLRAADGAAAPDTVEVYAASLDEPFGLAFYPPGPEPQWLYVATPNAVMRFAYRNGDLKARGEPETVVARLSADGGGHSTRDVVFSGDGKRMFVSVGSASNAGQSMGSKTADEIRRWEAEQGLGAAWGNEARRADVLVFGPDGKDGRIHAAGIRNCVGMAVHARTGDLWCSVNERDGLGDDLAPDFVTRVRDGAFYGWPWYYIGANEDPRHRGARPDLASKVTVPDVLLQPHSAAMQMAFYDSAAGAPAAFPAEYLGDAFVALHGSWNRSKRTGYKVVRVRVRDGVPTGEYEDFLTGFVVDDDRVWGRPVGVAIARDGALLVTEDGNGTIWRVSPDRAAPSR